jgi:hypothetical protein
VLDLSSSDLAFTADEVEELVGARLGPDTGSAPRIWLDATPEDRAVFSLTHPGVVEHASRTTAYEEQVCTK